MTVPWIIIILETSLAWANRQTARVENVRASIAAYYLSNPEAYTTVKEVSILADEFIWNFSYLCGGSFRCNCGRMGNVIFLIE